MADQPALMKIGRGNLRLWLVASAVWVIGSGMVLHGRGYFPSLTAMPNDNLQIVAPHRPEAHASAVERCLHLRPYPPRDLQMEALAAGRRLSEAERQEYERQLKRYNDELPGRQQQVRECETEQYIAASTAIAQHTAQEVRRRELEGVAIMLLPPFLVAGALLGVTAVVRWVRAGYDA